jgi:hypothetical protein
MVDMEDAERTRRWILTTGGSADREMVTEN